MAENVAVVAAVPKVEVVMELLQQLELLDQLELLELLDQLDQLDQLEQLEQLQQLMMCWRRQFRMHRSQRLLPCQVHTDCRLRVAVARAAAVAGWVTAGRWDHASSQSRPWPPQ